MFEFFSPSGSHTILVYRSYTDTKHRAASLRQQNFLLSTVLVVATEVLVLVPVPQVLVLYGKVLVAKRDVHT